MQDKSTFESATLSGAIPTILVTGANGFIGRALCASLVAHGHVVRGAVRRSYAILNSPITQINVGEINSKTDWESALDGVDVVIHLAARVHVMSETAIDPLEEFRQGNLYGTEHLARSAAAQGVKRLVYISSIKVNGEASMTGRPFTESDVPEPKDPYGKSKWEAEKVLRKVSKETGLEIVIVRPPLIYGPGVKGNFERILRTISDGIPLPLASIKNMRSLLYIENLVDALRACSIHPEAAGKTYLLSDGIDISTPDLIRQLAMAMGKPVRLFPFPIPLLKIAGILVGKSEEIERLLGSLQIDSGKIRRELNWQPPYSLQQGLQATVAWYQLAIAHPSKNRA